MIEQTSSNIKKQRVLVVKNGKLSLSEPTVKANETIQLSRLLYATGNQLD